MDETLRITSTSKHSAIGADIVLREKGTTRLIFRPELVDNPHNKEASVRGNFIFQKKSIKSDWEDHKELDLTKLKATEWIKLEIKAGELFTLITELNNYYKIFERYGIRMGKSEFLITSQNIQQIISQLLQDKNSLNKLIDQGGTSVLTEVIKWLVGIGDTRQILTTLKEIKVSDLNKLNSLIHLNCLTNILVTWEDNKNNKSEDFWQNLFKTNSWVLAQLFAHPMVIFQDKAFVGGKGIDNRGGNIVDFIYKNKLTENSVLIEIKTPVTKLLSSEYRDNIYCVSSDLTGSINQILTYKEELQRNFSDLVRNSNQPFQSFNPQCIVLIGCLKMEKFNEKQKRSFEVFRNDFKNVAILTFDELFDKIKQLVNLFEGKTQ